MIVTTKILSFAASVNYARQAFAADGTWNSLRNDQEKNSVVTDFRVCNTYLLIANIRVRSFRHVPSELSIARRCSKMEQQKIWIIRWNEVVAARIPEKQEILSHSTPSINPLHSKGILRKLINTICNEV